ncbi:hypothetical protein K458DRAFT_436196 [Lentithecium fluviatile CBS 122367]|uniref:Uncharacterized protein n=1 Tax=Lentithecium fluviatile CBS 122367 TaxID=1168545 RepID=A0A6G1IIH3_9PLEO|nr:hypothetical protein K458DRAFT_436196 [Lentithecium fluviatile CBS 122367]
MLDQGHKWLEFFPLEDTALSRCLVAVATEMKSSDSDTNLVNSSAVQLQESTSSDPPHVTTIFPLLVTDWTSTLSMGEVSRGSMGPMSQSCTTIAPHLYRSTWTPSASNPRAIRSWISAIVHEVLPMNNPAQQIDSQERERPEDSKSDPKFRETSRFLVDRQQRDEAIALVPYFASSSFSSPRIRAPLHPSNFPPSRNFKEPLTLNTIGNLRSKKESCKNFSSKGNTGP